jgi:hypothetical protein
MVIACNMRRNVEQCNRDLFHCDFRALIQTEDRKDTWARNPLSVPYTNPGYSECDAGLLITSLPLLQAQYIVVDEPRLLRQYSVWLRAGRSGFDSQQGQRIFLLAPASRPALGPTQPSIQWVPGVLSPGVKRGRGVTLTIHPHLVPRYCMSRSYSSSSPPCASMACSGTALLFFLHSSCVSLCQWYQAAVTALLSALEINNRTLNTGKRQSAYLHVAVQTLCNVDCKWWKVNGSRSKRCKAWTSHLNSVCSPSRFPH